MTEPFVTGRPSSEKAAAPASFRSQNSERIFPSRFRVIDATGWTRAFPQAAASRRMNSVTERLSLTGSVLAMQATAVKPPAAAASQPVRMVSLYS
jgi:hypothetical protein